MAKSSSDPLQCQECNSKPATLFVTKTVGNKVVRQNLCEPCARVVAARNLGDRAIHAPLEEILRVLFQNDLADQTPSALDVAAASPDWWHTLVEFSADEDIADEEAEAMEELDEAEVQSHDSRQDTIADTALNADAIENTESVSAQETSDNEASIQDEQFTEQQPETNEFANFSLVPTQRCPKCGTTWDRLKQDGRAGCAQCYIAFDEELTTVLERMQKSALHEGKTPRAADKRQKRLMQLRLRRDHRLEMLQRRLHESLEKEDYAEAAKLRDKIKIVSATIVEE